MVESLMDEFQGFWGDFSGENQYQAQDQAIVKQNGEWLGGNL